MGSDQETRMGATFEAWAIPEEGEWPKRDAVPRMASLAPGWASHSVIDQRPAEVTPEMCAAGAAVAPDPTKGLAGFLTAVFQAMHALAPVELVSPAEIAMIRERDGWKRQAEKWKGDFLSARDVLNCNEREIAANAAMIDKLTDWNCEYGAKNERLSDDVDSLRAELMAAHDKLARQAKALGDAANTIAALTPRTESTPDPIANAIRGHDTDRRRMGS